MYTKEELKKIKISIKRKMPTSVDLDNTIEETIDYSFSNDEKLPIHTRPLEGTKPLFNEESANRINTPTPTPERFPSRLSSRQNSPYENGTRELEIVSNKLEDLLEELKETTRAAERDARNAEKRSRSRSSSYSNRSRSNSVNRRRKRMRRDSEDSNRHKYGHSSKCNIYNEREKGNERKRRYHDRSRSSSTNRSFSSYLSRKLEKDMSSVLNDSVLSKHSRRSDGKYSSNTRKKSESKYDRKSSRKSEKRETNYNHNHDYYRQDSYYHDMKERYARYYTVMYAFNIIMDILRKDDLYNSQY